MIDKKILDCFTGRITNDSRVFSSGDIFVLEDSAISFLDKIINAKPFAILTSVNSAHVVEDSLLRNGFNLPDGSLSIDVFIYENKEQVIDLLKTYYNSLPDNIWAITGTNGKTSTCSFVYQLLLLMGQSAISIGTLGTFQRANGEDFFWPSNLTTPSIYDFYHTLFHAKKQGVNYAIFESSSHGLKQGRCDGVNISIGGITNVTHDHLDYHSTFEDYFGSKMLLFSKYIRRGGVAIVNRDMIQYDDIVAKYCDSLKIIDYGKHADVLKVIKTKIITDGPSFKINIEIEISGFRYDFDVNTVADFQIENICVAICYLYAAGFDIKKTTEQVKFLLPPKGRMEQVIADGKNYPIFVDYAHTPDALEKAIKTLRVAFPSKKIITVFGCGGDRDESKRPIMCSVAVNLSNFVIVTDDNPRTEDPAFIRKQIIAGSCGKESLIEIEGRENAIEYAIKKFKNSVILIAGKGHEDYQIIGKTKHYFSDIEIAKNILHSEVALA